MNQQIHYLKFKRQDPLPRVQAGLEELFTRAGFGQVITKNDLTAIKVHFGEEGNTTFIPASYISPIVRAVRKQGAKPFVSDSNVLYKSKRDNAVDHIELAKAHGFTLESLGAPVVIADGISGQNEIEVPVDAPLNKTVDLAADFVTARSIITVTHVTGHVCTGLAATIKNLGMGMSSRKGKLRQHSVSKPTVSTKSCTRCGECLIWCPEDAITMEEKSALIHVERCIGCGECLAVCRDGAVKFRWDSSNDDLQKQIAEHALGIVKQKKGKIGYYTFMINMTRDCDCMHQGQGFVMEDLGVIAGHDPVAMDQAVIDLTTDSLKKNIATLSFPEINPLTQLEYGEKIGLGSRKYTIVEI